MKRAKKNKRSSRKNPGSKIVPKDAAVANLGGKKLQARLDKGLIPARLAEKLRKIRLHLGKSQGKMLIAVNPRETEDNRARVSQWERGKRLPSLVEARNYARLVKIPMEMLIDDDTDLPFN